MLLKCPGCGASVPGAYHDCPECGCPLSSARERQDARRFSATTPPDDLRRAADGGEPEAMYWLGYCLHFGENGFAQDDPAAESWLEHAASLGNAAAEADRTEWFGTRRADAAAGAPLGDLLSRFDSLIVFDLETSGLDPKSETIIEFAAIRVVSADGGLSAAGELNEMIRLPQGKALSPRITELTGITDDMLLRAGKPPAAVCEDFLSLLGSGSTLMISYNAQFDMSFLRHFLAQNGAGSAFEALHTIDALSVYKDRRPYPHRLKDAIAAYHLEALVENSHHAIDDTRSLLEVIKAMDREQSDLARYIDLFGYNPKYGISGERLPGIRYIAQPYYSRQKLYEK